MNILHIHISDSFSGGGGGGVVMHRLHRALLDRGFQSRILSGSQNPAFPDSRPLPRLRGESLLRSVTARLGLNDIHRLGSFLLPRDPFFRDADLVHFHGIHSGTFSYLAFPAVTRRKPTVFTLHDMWALTGHCAYSYDCGKWETGCGRCPYPEAAPAIRRDATAWEWKLKQWAYRRSRMSIIAPSRRLAEQARRGLLADFPIFDVPHGIDTSLFRPLEKKKCREFLGIPEDRYVLMFSALRLDQPNKGGDLLLAALKDLPREMARKTVLLLVGKGGRQIKERSGLESVDLGYLSEDRIKPIAYSAADLFVSPTRAEAFGLVLLESMACGTPVVSFDVGGVPDLVVDGKTGILARPEDVSELRDGIRKILQNDRLRQSMNEACRDYVVEEFSLTRFVDRHLEVYRQAAPTGGQEAAGFGSTPRSIP